MTKETTTNTPPWVIAITGASGVCYGCRLLQVIGELFPQQKLEVVFSDASLRVLTEEEENRLNKKNITSLEFIGLNDNPNITIHNNADIGATIASGSYKTSGMIVVPCSMRTLSMIACGFSDSLIGRAADVILKEQRKLILVPRESPFSVIHLENMLKLAKMGVLVAPPVPGFYHQPSSVSEIIDMIVMRLLDHMKFDTSLVKRWKEDVR